MTACPEEDLVTVHTIESQHCMERMAKRGSEGVVVVQMEAVVGIWVAVALQLPMAPLLLAMSTLATSRAPGTERRA